MKLLLIWMVVWTLSFLIHEFGHAFAYRRYGGQPWIVLQSFYGYAACNGRFTRGQQVVISAAGPVVEILFGVAAFLILGAVEGIQPYVRSFLFLFGYICVVWGGLNLLPILPLDGGRILEALWGKGERPVGKVGMVTAVIAAVVLGVVFKFFLGALFFGFLAYVNYKRSQGVSINI
ncbi:MAG: site-2 protease family protein [Verrucomicrobiota bacterium]